ncbi:hypothetical protein K2173_013977 [Erythroxylum novogranatense]|uniref:Uncharacterized protein n=1 Tax=Erythroxylum novogranatense TaxID=1862640 RepID=A0AAV8SD34_9ROSI|nr:hypothetical protein K2173_013977 [Erythroxylum novogranatense]
MEAVKKAAMKAGTFRSTISEVRPMAMDVIDNGERGKDVGGRMVEALWQESNLKAVTMVKRERNQELNFLSPSEGWKMFFCLFGSYPDLLSF